MRSFSSNFTLLTRTPRLFTSTALRRQQRLPTLAHHQLAPMSTSPPSPPHNSSSGSGPSPTPPNVVFPISPIPPNPLGDGRYIKTAAALVIGDEILNGKTLDRNSHTFAQHCFVHGVELKRVEVIADNEDEIVEASRRLVNKFDLVITSGGIGPTHDDITYQSLAKAFNQNLVHHEETIRRMSEMNKYRKWVGTQDPQQLAATRRMALFPEKAEVIFVGEDIWVPVVRLEGKLCIFPGIPALFQKMLHGLTPFLPLPPKGERPLRIQVFTERAESMIAPYLTALQKRLKPHGIQVGSYPVLYKGVFVSLIGRDLESKEKGGMWLAEVAKEVEREVEGRVVSDEEVAARKRGATLEGWDARKEMGQMEDLSGNQPQGVESDKAKF